MSRLRIVYAGLVLFLMIFWGSVYVAVGGPVPR